MFGTVFESFHETSFLSPNPKFVGMALYQRVVGDGVFPEVLVNSIVWTLGVVLLQNLFGFLTALLLNQSLPMQGALRAIVLLPFILPGVVAAILWRFMYDPQLGLINSLLIQLGVIDNSVAWLADSNTAMASVIVAAVWKGFPFSMLIYLAALQNVDQSQIEAATIDGAGPFRRLIDVVLPAIRDVIVVNIVLTLILTFNYFDIIWVLTKGGPQSATHIFPTKIYETGFGQFRFGEAATYGVFSILVLAVLVALYAIVQGSANRRRASA
jgi:multiple sugar transport system permease protein